MRHCEGVGRRVAVGDTEMSPAKLPPCGVLPAPCILGWLEQAQAPTASIAMRKNIASREIRLRTDTDIKRRPVAHSSAT
jgi:hypothetical protein